MKGQMVQHRIRTLKESMGGLDAVVASSLENTYYFSGSYIMTIRSIPDRLALVLIPKDGDPTFLVCVIEESLVRKESPIADVRAYVEFAENPADLLGKVIEEKGLEGATIGIETRHLSASYRQRLDRVARGVTWQSADALLGRLRAVKAQAEVEALTRGAEVTERAILDSWSNARVGHTERAVALDMANCMLAGGLESVSFLCMGSGFHCGDAHPTPGPRKLLKGDLIRCDVGGLFKHYQTDVARTGVLGKPTSSQQKRYRAIFEAQHNVIEAMKPGTPVRDLWNLAAKTVQSHGYAFTAPHIGHSIGIGLHEDPMLQPFNDASVEEGMVFYVEPFMRTGPKDGYHVEDLVLVTPDGGVVLTDPEGIRSELFVL